MFTLIIKEYETSASTTRENVPTKHAHNMGENGGFYSVQLVNPETNVIEFEYK